MCFGQFPEDTTTIHHPVTRKPLTAHSKPPPPTLRPAGQWSLLFMSKVWGLNRLTESHGQDTVVTDPQSQQKAMTKGQHKA